MRVKQRIKKDATKGFTLVELIVVLVILAILAALLIPSLTGYIDQAREKQAIIECRAVVQSAQTIVVQDYYATNTAFELDEAARTEILTLAEVRGQALPVVTVDAAGQVTAVLYQSSGGLFVTYQEKTYTIGNVLTIDNGGIRTLILSGVAAAMEKHPNSKNFRTIDSGAVGQTELSGVSTDLSIELAKFGLQVNNLGATVWQYVTDNAINNGNQARNTLNWTTVPPVSGSQAPVLRYDPNTGEYAVCTATFTKGTGDYQILSNYQEIEKFESYEAALTRYNQRIAQAG